MSSDSKKPEQEMDVKITQGRYIMTEKKGETEVMLITGSSGGGNKPPLGPPPVVPGAPETEKPELEATPKGPEPQTEEATKPELEATPKAPEPKAEEATKPEPTAEADKPEPTPEPAKPEPASEDPKEELEEEPDPSETQEITLADHAKWFGYRALIWGVLVGFALMIVGGLVWAIMQNKKHDATPAPVLAQEQPKAPVDLPPPPKASLMAEKPEVKTPVCPPAPACECEECEDCDGKVAEALKSAEADCAKKLAAQKVETPKAPVPVVKQARPRPRHITAEFYDEQGNLLRKEKIPRH